jgi:hypothetical protein
MSPTLGVRNFLIQATLVGVGPLIVVLFHLSLRMNELNTLSNWLFECPFFVKCPFQSFAFFFFITEDCGFLFYSFKFYLFIFLQGWGLNSGPTP